MAGNTVIRHYVVEGRVQGVGYRRFVQRSGEALGLNGAVRNLDDGRVEVIANGREDTLAKFEAELMRGPSHSKVNDRRTTKLRSDQIPIEAADPIASGLFAILKDGEKKWF